MLALTGPLGSCKTTFTQLLAKELGIKRDVKSPTFMVMHLHKLIANSYKPKATTLCHVDAYRLNDPHELEAIGLYDYLGQPEAITVVEWAERIKEALPPQTKWLKFNLTDGKRTVEP